MFWLPENYVSSWKGCVGSILHRKRTMVCLWPTSGCYLEFKCGCLAVCSTLIQGAHHYCIYKNWLAHLFVNIEEVHVVWLPQYQLALLILYLSISEKKQHFLIRTTYVQTSLNDIPKLCFSNGTKYFTFFLPLIKPRDLNFMKWLRYLTTTWNKQTKVTISASRQTNQHIDVDKHLCIWIALTKICTESSRNGTTTHARGLLGLDTMPSESSWFFNRWMIGKRYANVFPDPCKNKGSKVLSKCCEIKIFSKCYRLYHTYWGFLKLLGKPENKL